MSRKTKGESSFRGHPGGGYQKREGVNDAGRGELGGKTPLTKKKRKRGPCSWGKLRCAKRKKEREGNEKKYARTTLAERVGGKKKKRSFGVPGPGVSGKGGNLPSREKRAMPASRYRSLKKGFWLTWKEKEGEVKITLPGVPEEKKKGGISCLYPLKEEVGILLTNARGDRQVDRRTS